MINIPSPLSGRIESSPVPLLNIPQNVQRHLNSFKNHNNDLKVDHKTFPFKTINVKKTEFDKCKEILEWRRKTQFPIVKVQDWKILSEKMHGSESHLDVLIELESFFKSLQDFQKIPFAHSIYILKESLIGFQRLCYRFGSFKVNSSIIKFNEFGICKVWINRDCFLNELPNNEINSEHDFIIELCQVIKNKITKTSSARIFFQSIQNCQYFFEAIGAIDEFTRQNMINVPNSVQNLDDCKSPLLKMSLNLNLAQQQKRQTFAISSAVPAFLKKNQRQKKNNSIQTPNLSPTKNVALKNKGFLERSLTDVDRKFSNFARSRKHSTRQLNLASKKQSPDKFLVQNDQFCEGFSIRLMQPNDKKDNLVHSEEIVQGCKLIPENNPESNKGVMGQVSDLDSSQEFKQKFSLNHEKNKKHTNPHETNSNIAVKVSQPKRLNGSFSQTHLVLACKSRYSKEIKITREIQQDFEHSEKDTTKLSINFKNFKDKRKYSGDIDSFSGRKNQQTTKIQNKKVPSFLNAIKNAKNKSFLTKSPSHQIISFSSKQIESGCDQKDNAFLRGTFLIGNDWNLSEEKGDKDNKKYDLPIPKQTPRQEEPTKKVQLKKLTSIGRQVKESSQTEDVEFELEYGTKIEKEKFIRNEIMNVLI